MTGKDLIAGIGRIDESLIQEVETQIPKRHWGKWIGLAACLAVLAVSVATQPLFKEHSDITMKENGGNTNTVPPVLSSDAVGESLPVEGSSPSKDSNTGSEPVAEQPGAPVNELKTPPKVGETNGIALSVVDRVTLSYDEMLEYFSVTLPVPELLPGFRPADDTEYCIYKRSNGEVYGDLNTFTFFTADKTQTVGVTLAKNNRLFAEIEPDFLASDHLSFTRINGRDYAVFHYRDEQGEDCYHLQFRKDGVDYYIGSTNLPLSSFLKLAAALAPEQGNAPQSHSCTLEGTVDLVDPNAGWVGFQPSDGQEEYLIIRLTDPEKAAQYSIGCSISVTFRGEPATIGNLWEQQITELRILSK